MPGKEVKRSWVCEIERDIRRAGKKLRGWSWVKVSREDGVTLVFEMGQEVAPDIAFCACEADVHRVDGGWFLRPRYERLG
jgi:hypothetical protein